MVVVVVQQVLVGSQATRLGLLGTYPIPRFAPRPVKSPFGRRVQRWEESAAEADMRTFARLSGVGSLFCPSLAMRRYRLACLGRAWTGQWNPIGHHEETGNADGRR